MIRKRDCILLAGCLLSLASCAPREAEVFDAELFRNPTAEFRSVTFYSLNDSLRGSTIGRHLREFREGGFGGAFFHARIGLLTPYMGPAWWEAIDAGVEAAEREGLQAWFYDEDKWPSGFAGGKMPLADPQFTSQCIVRIDRNTPLKEGARVLAEDARYRYVTDRAAWGEWRFNGTAYVDLLSRRMVGAFIDTTYRAYVGRYGARGGKAVRGVFTDEPQIAPRPSVGNSGSVSYTSELPATFRARNGYELTEALPLLFNKEPGCEKARIDFYRTVAQLFEENFARQIGEYCADNGFLFTGHFMGEESAMSVARYSGNGMALYRHMQVPGIDHLRLSPVSLTNAKSMSSVANQYGRRRRLCEAYGIGGHNMSFEDRKWLLDYLTLAGVNLISPHLSAYSLKGERKRDYPPTFSAHQPYWPYNKLFEDYSARMCYAASLGRYAADIAVLSPLESAYIELDPAVNRWNNARTELLSNLLERLQQAHRDYDLVDEQIAAEIARVGREGLVVGEMAYRTVILPDLLTVRRSTVALLEELARRGGQVLVAGGFPEFVDGVRDTVLLGRLRRIARPLDADAPGPTLDSLAPPAFRVEGAGAEHVWTQRRRLAGGTLIQLSNTSRREGASCRLTFAGQPDRVALWDAVTGESYALEADAEGGFRIDFAPTGSWIVTTGRASAGADRSRTHTHTFAPTTGECVAEIGAPWRGRRLDPNVLTLDFARYSTDGGRTFSAPEPVIGIHARLRDRGYDGPLLLKYEVTARMAPAACSLAVEQPAMYRSVTVNGRPAAFSDAWFCDESFRLSPLGGLIGAGGNEIVLALDYAAPRPADSDPLKRYGTEIEAIYLVGDFAVRAYPSAQPPATSQRNRSGLLREEPVLSYSRFELDAEREEFQGELTGAGYPFYAGSFRLENRFKLDRIEPGRRYVLRFPAFGAIVVRAEVNGHETAPLVFSPFETDVTELIRAGENTLAVTMTNSLRNMLGPHHHKGGELIAVGPLSFTGETSWTGVDRGETDWYDVRTTDKQPGIWRDDYYMVPFGPLSAARIELR